MNPTLKVYWGSWWMMVRINCTGQKVPCWQKLAIFYSWVYFAHLFYHLTYLKWIFKTETREFTPGKFSEAPLVRSNLSSNFFLRNEAVICANLLTGTWWMFSVTVSFFWYVDDGAVTGVRCIPRAGHPLLTWCHCLETWTRAPCITLRHLGSAGHL